MTPHSKATFICYHPPTLSFTDVLLLAKEINQYLLIKQLNQVSIQVNKQIVRMIPVNCTETSTSSSLYHYPLNEELETMMAMTLTKSF